MSSVGNNSLLAGNKLQNKVVFLPTENEWVKFANYDPSTQTYWQYATQSNTAPSKVNITNSDGSGAPNGSGNFANYSSAAVWGGVIGIYTTPGTNGGPSAYGTFDACGNVQEWTEFNGTATWARGGSWSNSGAPTVGTRVQFISNAASSNTGFRLCAYAPINSNFVPVGNINNPNHSTGFGSVSYNFYVNKYTVTVDEYVEFLNSVATGAAGDTYGLYRTAMTTDTRGGINRLGSVGSYYYAAKTNFGNKPVVQVSWYMCARYCNWVTNGKPSGPQTTATTEDGIYFLNGNTGAVVTRKSV